MSTTRSKDVHPAVILMGVSGCGKSTFGRFLEKEQNFKFTDGDDLHPPSNVAKMSDGTPLDDDDREPWLDAICEHIKEVRRSDTLIAVACSALKKKYRDKLRTADEQLLFVHLVASEQEIASRLNQREGHFMPPELLRSQFETLEPTDDEADVVEIDVAQQKLNVERDLLKAIQK